MSQVLRVAEAFAEDQPRVRRHAIVDKFEGNQQIVRTDLLADALDDVCVDLGVLAHRILVQRVLRAWAAISPIIGIRIGVTLGVGILDVLPDADSCLSAEFLEIFVELVLSFLQLSASAFVREDKDVFDHVDSSHNVHRHLKVVRLQVVQRNLDLVPFHDPSSDVSKLRVLPRIVREAFLGAFRKFLVDLLAIEDDFIGLFLAL